MKAAPAEKFDLSVDEDDAPYAGFQLLRSVEHVHPVCEPGDSTSRSSWYQAAKGNVIEADFGARVVRVWNSVGGQNIVPFENCQNMKPLAPDPMPKKGTQ